MKNKCKYTDDTLELHKQAFDLYKKYVDWKLLFLTMLSMYNRWMTADDNDKKNCLSRETLTSEQKMTMEQDSELQEMI